jgi:Beta propeller domain
MFSKQLLVTSVVSVLVLFSGCGGGSGTDSSNSGGNGGTGGGNGNGAVPANDVVQQGAEKITVSIKSFDSQEPCTELQAYLVDYADQVMRQRLTALRDSQYDYAQRPGSPVPLGDIAMTPQLGTPVSAPAGIGTGTSAGSSTGAGTGTNNQSASATPPANGGFTTTNVQTLGIDELDEVKNNDRHVFRLHREFDRTVLSKARYWPATALAQLGKVVIPLHTPEAALRSYAASVRGLFVTDSEQAIVLSSLNSGGMPWYATTPALGPTPVAGSSAAISVADRICPTDGCYSGPQVQKSYVDIFDASTASTPLLQGSIEIGGTLIDARRRGDRIWVLTQESFRFPAAVIWSPPNLDYAAPVNQRKLAFDRLIEQNALSIRAAELGQWLPEDLALATKRSLEAANGVCRSIRKVSEASELHWLRIASVKLSDRSVANELILAEGQTVYASHRAIYVSTPNWRAPDSVDPGPRTFVHKFSIAGDDVARYSGSGAFAGQPLNAYSFDEDEQGNLRFAANALNVQAGDSARPFAWEPYSYLGVMKQQDSRLVVAAQSARIAPGERMQSARFVGARGYLVTFRQVDPFYVFDMNASGGPKALGELKIPGFSTYLHPLGDHHIIGIGYADGNWPRRIKASLFDVSDPSNPREQSTLLLGDVYSGSEALWNPHAFSYLPRSANAGTLAVPIWSFNYNSAVKQHSGLKILNVSAAQGLSLVGELSVDDLLQPPASALESHALFVRRSILTEHFVFGIGHRVLRSATLAKPEQALATLITE